MPRSLRRVLPTALAFLAPLAALISVATPSASAAKLPPIKHVWIIMLENENYNYTFGAAGQKFSPYLAETLPKEGALLKDYYGTGHDSLDNYVASVSGQAGNYTLNEDCSIFAPFIQFGGENYDDWTKYGQLSGDGCVFPAEAAGKPVLTVGNQLSAKGLTWKQYSQDMGNDPKRDGTVQTSEGPACGHPQLGGTDYTDSTAPKNDSYATRHNGFMYFESVIGNKALCDKHVVSLTPLTKDLESVSTTPNYSFITPNTCYDGHDWPKCQNGTAGRLPKVEVFLKEWIPKIMASPAYKKNGMILITTDEAGDDSVAGACCGEVDGLGFDDPSHPNLNEPGLYGPGGGKVGAIVLSPFVKPGTVSPMPYNHYSQLATVEDLFGLPLLGDAKQPQVKPFGSDVFTHA
jgi:phosphatidylinositol-3-phosphatase